MRTRSVVIILCFFGCQASTEPKQTLITLLDPPRTHLHFTNTLVFSEDFNIIDYLYFYVDSGIISDESNWSTGVSIADVNVDGWLDI